MAPTGGRSIASGVEAVVGTIPQMSAVDTRRLEVGVAETGAVETGPVPPAPVAAFVGCDPGRGPLERTRIAAPSNVTSMVPSRSVR